MSRVRVCFLGTPEFAVKSLKALFEDEHFELVGVVTQPDRPSGRKLQLTPSPVKQFALAHGLKVLTPESLKADPETTHEILKWGAEVAVVVAFGQILSKEFLQAFPLGAVNVHGSLLPKWRGAAPIQRSLEAGDRVTGVCIQKMVQRLDAGEVIAERAIEIPPDMDAEELFGKLADLGADLLRVEFMDYVRGNLAGRVQDESQVTWAKKIDKSEALLHWNLPADTIHNKVRAFVMGPGTYVIFQGKKLKILKTKVLETGTVGHPGQVLRVDAHGLAIQCNPGVLQILEVQPESRNRMLVPEFLKGTPLQAKDFL